MLQPHEGVPRRWQRGPPVPGQLPQIAVPIRIQLPSIFGHFESVHVPIVAPVEGWLAVGLGDARLRPGAEEVPAATFGLRLAVTRVLP
jgi:hypothetical protein